MTTDRLLDICLPNGGLVLSFIECYFDESGTHDNSCVMAVAGYVFDKEAAKLLNTLWNSVLADHKIPYFHMTDCATKNDIFRNIDEKECDLIARKLIHIIKLTATLGLSCAVNEAEYNEVFAGYNYHGSAYTFCIRRILGEFERGFPFSEPVKDCSFFFETGHDSQNESNKFMNELFSDKESVKDFKYSSHAFVTKQSSPAIQAADILAYLTYKDLKNVYEGFPRKRRKDYLALLEIPTQSVFATKQNLINIRTQYEEGGYDHFYKTGEHNEKIANSLKAANS